MEFRVTMRRLLEGTLQEDFADPSLERPLDITAALVEQPTQRWFDFSGSHSDRHSNQFHALRSDGRSIWRKTSRHTSNSDSSSLPEVRVTSM